MQRCKLCSEYTSGSVGAAGIHWPSICQKCKDREDQALARLVKSNAKILDATINLIK